MKLIVVRHGESEGNVDHNVYKVKHQWDINLTENGARQIAETAEKIHNYVSAKDTVVARIITSNYKRAINSAQIIAYMLQYPGIILQEFLCSEQSYGLADGQPSLREYAETRPDEKELYRMQGFPFYGPPRGETPLDVYTRVGVFVEKHKSFVMGQYPCIVVAHKGFCLMLQAYLTNKMPSIEYLEKGDWDNGQAKVFCSDNPLLPENTKIINL